MRGPGFGRAWARAGRSRVWVGERGGLWWTACNQSAGQEHNPSPSPPPLSRPAERSQIRARQEQQQQQHVERIRATLQEQFASLIPLLNPMVSVVGRSGAAAASSSSAAAASASPAVPRYIASPSRPSMPRQPHARRALDTSSLPGDAPPFPRQASWPGSQPPPAPAPSPSLDEGRQGPGSPSGRPPLSQPHTGAQPSTPPQQLSGSGSGSATWRQTWQDVEADSGIRMATVQVRYRRGTRRGQKVEVKPLRQCD